MNVEELKVKISVDMAGFKSQMNNVKSSLNGVSNSAKSTSKGMSSFATNVKNAGKGLNSTKTSLTGLSALLSANANQSAIASTNLSALSTIMGILSGATSVSTSALSDLGGKLYKIITTSDLFNASLDALKAVFTELESILVRITYSVLGSLETAFEKLSETNEEFYKTWKEFKDNWGETEFEEAINKIKELTKEQNKLTEATEEGAEATKEANKNTGETVTKLGKIGAVIGIVVLAVKKLSSAIKDCVEKASNLTEIQNVVDTVYDTIEEASGMSKDLNDKISAWAGTLVSSYGLSETVAKKYVSNFGAMAESMGLVGEQAVGMSMQLTKMAGDVASFYNLDTDTAYTKLKSVFTGETETLKELGVVMTETNLQEYALTKGIKKSYSEMTQAEKVGLRYSFVMDKLSKAQGDFARTSDSWANQTRILSLQWAQLKANIGTGFIYMLTPVIKLLNKVVEKLMIASYYVKYFFSLLGFNTNISGGLQDTATSLDSMADGLASATDNANELAETLKGLSGIDEINSIANNTSNTDSQIGIDTSVLDSLDSSLFDISELDVDTSFLDTIYDKVKGFIDKCKKVWDGFIKSLKKSGIYKLIMEKWEIIKKGLSTIVDGIKEIFGGIYDVIKGVVEIIVGLFTGDWATVKQGFKDLGKGIVEIFGGIIDTISGLFEAIGGIILGVVDVVIQIGINLITVLVDAFKEGANKLKEIFAPVEEKMAVMKQAFSDWWDGFKTSLTEGIDNIKTKFSNAWDNIKTKASETFDGIKTSFRNLKTNIVNTATNIISSIGTKLKTAKDKAVKLFSEMGTKIGEGVKSAFTSVLNKAFEKVESILNTPINAINKLLDKVNTLPGVHITPLSGLSLPRLATGGIVTSSTIANIGENGKEAVLPLEKNTQWMDILASKLTDRITNNNSSNPIEIVLDIGGNRFGKACIASINEAQRQSGTLLLEI